MSKPLRVGIIGTGSRGITCIGRQIAEQSRELNVTLTAFCNPTPSRMRIALDELNGIAAATKMDKAKLILYNVAYELEGACTSVVAQVRFLALATRRAHAHCGECPHCARSLLGGTCVFSVTPHCRFYPLSLTRSHSRLTHTTVFSVCL